MDSILIKCKKCGVEFRVPAEMAGKKGKCSCGAIIIVPAGEDASEQKAGQAGQEWYYVKGGERQGPLSAEGIGMLVQSGDLSTDSLLWTEGFNEWTPLSEIPAFSVESGERTAQTSTAAVDSGEAPPLSRDMWYYSKDGAAHGPVSESQLREIIRTGQLAPEQLVYSPKDGKWRRISEVDALSVTKQADGQTDQGVSPDGTAGRRHPEAQHWYAISNNQQIGPYSLDEIKLIVSRRGLTASDLVWHSDLGDWKPVKSVKELAEDLPRVPTLSGKAMPWYYMREGQTKGPLNYDEICEALAGGTIGKDTMVFSKPLGVWKEARFVEELKHLLKSAPGQAHAGRASAEAVRSAGEWHYVDGADRKGPFTRDALTALISQGKVSSGAMVWRGGMPAWKQASKVSEFSGCFDRVTRKESAASETGKSPGSQTAKRDAGHTGKAPSLKTAAVVGILFFLAALAAVLLFLPKLTKNGAPAENGKQSEQPAKAGGDPAKPPAYGESVKGFLKGFLSDDENARKAALAKYCPGGWIDVFSDDLAAMAKAMIQSAEPEIREVPCSIIRAAKTDSFFCYHVASKNPQIDVTLLDERQRKSQHRFLLKDFTPVRCFMARWPGKTALAGLPVLAIDKGNGLEIVSLGRTGYVGASAGGRQIEYMTGTLHAEMAESKSQLFVRTTPSAEKSADDWRLYGAGMSADSRLIPGDAKRAYGRIIARGGKFMEDYVLIGTSPYLTMDEIAGAFGKPQRISQTRLYDAGFRIQSNGSMPTGNISVEVQFHGFLGIAVETGGKKTIGIVLPLPGK